MTEIHDNEHEIMQSVYADFDELFKRIPKPADPFDAADEVVRKDIEAEQVNLRG